MAIDECLRLTSRKTGQFLFAGRGKSDNSLRRTKVGALAIYVLCSFLLGHTKIEDRDRRASPTTRLPTSAIGIQRQSPNKSA
jgi:hypothetical protein